MPGGRPRKWTDPEALQVAIDEYFAECKAGETVQQVTKRGDVVTLHREIPSTVIGFALALGFVSRQSLFDYIDRNDEFSDIIARAKGRIEQNNLLHGLSGDYESRINTLNLAANFGYNTKQDVNLDVSGALQVLTVNFAGAPTDDPDEGEE